LLYSSLISECRSLKTLCIKSALPFYKEAGATSVNWLPLYFDPYLTGEEIGIECVISFVGNYFSDRLPACERILFPLIQKFEKDVHIFGSGWNETVVKRESVAVFS